MRGALWLVILFGAAVAIALFAGTNQGLVTIFWPPYRVDLSVNLVVLLLLATFVVGYSALRALAALFDLPRQAKRWRAQQKERAMHASLLDAQSYLLAGRFIRARKAAQAALHQEQSLGSVGVKLVNAVQFRALSHLAAAEGAQALQDRAARDEHLKQALEDPSQRHTALGQETREGAQLRAARWALDDGDASAALAWLDELPMGVARRTLALRIKLKAARLAHRTAEALETARLLAKHRAFPGDAAQSIVRGLATELIHGAYDTTQLLQVWNSLESSEREMPELAIGAAERMAALHGDAHIARDWLLPLWERMVSAPGSPASGLGDYQSIKLVRALELGLESVDASWLARIESAQQQNPRDARLQYLAGMTCLKRQLWGRAQLLLAQAVTGLQDLSLHRNAWRALAQLAQQRGDEAAAAQAWKRAAQLDPAA
ncbi:MAG: heme biosynthesis protein HemY [Burkholderiaceae bacterium]|nr:MAG: heme biosynthesis protein HemY [Burkholderiaceae bacterium]TBR72473.1 MAG: heme biosynthesis protein HemY [Burkholderiaceae bacterium]